MSCITDKYYKELKATKGRLITDIQYYISLEEQYDGDEFDGYEDIHLKRIYEGLPTEYITLTVRRYCENYVLAYTNDYDLIKEFDGRKWFWTPEEHRNLMFVGNYIIKIPYKLIALEDLYHIADWVCNEEDDEEEELGDTNWKSFMKELPDDD